MREYLTIDPELYFQAYNDPQIIYNYSMLGNNNLEYLSWGNAYKALKQYHPNLIPQVDGEFSTITNQVSDASILTEKLNKLIEDRTTVKEWKEKKQLETKILEIENQLTYCTRGYYFKVSLVCTDTELKTPSLLFPVMDNNNNSCLNPDTRDLTDNMQRAFVKAIAVYTGYGFRLFTRENIGKKLEESPIVIAIRNIHKFTGYKERKVELDRTVHLGQDIDVLRKLYKELNEYEIQLAKDKSAKEVESK